MKLCERKRVKKKHHITKGRSYSCTLQLMDAKSAKPDGSLTCLKQLLDTVYFNKHILESGCALESGPHAEQGFGTEPAGGITLVDVPGLIDGASEGRGMGIKFLRRRGSAHSGSRQNVPLLRACNSCACRGTLYRLDFARHIMNFHSELCRRRSGAFTEVAHFILRFWIQSVTCTRPLGH